MSQEGSRAGWRGAGQAGRQHHKRRPPASAFVLHLPHPAPSPVLLAGSHLGNRLDALAAAHLFQLQLLDLVLGALPPLAHRRAKVALQGWQGGGGVRGQAGARGVSAGARQAGVQAGSLQRRRWQERGARHAGSGTQSTPIASWDLCQTPWLPGTAQQARNKTAGAASQAHVHGAAGLHQVQLRPLLAVAGQQRGHAKRPHRPAPRGRPEATWVAVRAGPRASAGCLGRSCQEAALCLQASAMHVCGWCPQCSTAQRSAPVHVEQVGVGAQPLRQHVAGDGVAVEGPAAMGCGGT